MKQAEPKLCECGCGRTTSIATMTRRKFGHVAGQPHRFLPGHRGVQVYLEPPNPSGLCFCGCGGAAPIATKTQRSKGYVEGEPMRYIKGHGKRRNLSPPNPSGLCQCGCGERTPLAVKSVARRGVVKGEPLRFILGHHARVQSEETIRKRSDAQRGKPLTAEHRRRVSLANGGTGETTPGTLHQRLVRDHPKSGVCEECGATGRRTEYAFKHHPEPHTDRRADYRELCRPCHLRFDAWLRLPKKSHLRKASDDIRASGKRRQS